MRCRSCICTRSGTTLISLPPGILLRRALFDPEGGMRDVRALDDISFADWFKSHGGSENSLKRMWDPIGALLLVVCPWLFFSRCVKVRRVGDVRTRTWDAV